MISQFFMLVEVIFRLFGLWDSFLNYSDTKRVADAAKKQAALNKAVDESAGKETDSEIFDNESEIVSNMPHP